MRRDTLNEKKDKSRQAVMDVGSNSIKLLVAEYIKDQFKIVLEANEYSRLGENLNKTGILSTTAIKRSVDAIESLIKQAYDGGAECIKLFGTSALRCARNADVFLNLVREQLGLQIKVLTGKEEAALIFKGVCTDSLFQNIPILMLDLGGGSAEWVLGRNGIVEQSLSKEIGCVRLTERFITNDPVSNFVRQKIENFLRSELSKELKNFPTSQGLVVITGGTSCCLATLIEPAFKEKFRRGESGLFTYKSFLEKVKVLQSFGREQIAALFSIPSMRADLIVTGGITLITIFEILKINEFYVSPRNLRYGLIATGILL